MKFTEYSYEEYQKKRASRGELFDFLNGFANSGFKCAILGEHHWRNSKQAQSSLSYATKRYDMPHIKIKIVGDDVFLINTLLAK